MKVKHREKLYSIMILKMIRARWEEVLMHLQKNLDLSSTYIDIMFRPLRVSEIKGDCLIILAPNYTITDMIERYVPEIERSIMNILGVVIHVRVKASCWCSRHEMEKYTSGTKDVDFQDNFLKVDQNKLLMDLKANWEKILLRVKGNLEISDPSYEVFLKYLKVAGIRNGIVYALAPDEILKEYIDAKYKRELRKVIYEHSGVRIPVVIEAPKLRKRIAE